MTTAVERAIDGSSSLTFDLVPGPGRHLVRYGGRFFMVERQREHQSFAMNTGEPWEKVLLTSFGRDVSVFDDLLEEARSMNMKQEEGATVIYTCWGTSGDRSGTRGASGLSDSVVLDDGVKEAIVSDLEEGAWPPGIMTEVFRIEGDTCCTARPEVASRVSSCRWQGSWTTTFASWRF